MKFKNILILAGGDSTRFWPLKEKATFSFLGLPIIQHIVEQLISFGENIYVVVNSNNNELIQKANPTVKTILQTNPNGMGGAIVSCKDKIDGEVLILNAEDMMDFSFITKYLQILQKNKKDYILLGKKTHTYFPGGYFKLDGEKVTEIIEKPLPENVPSNIVRLVSDYYNDFNIILDILQSTQTENDDWYEQGMNKYIQKYMNGCYVEYMGYWNALKYPWHVISMMSQFLTSIQGQQISKSASISKSAIISGPVRIEDNVKIGDFVKITGPVYIGKNSIVGDHTLLRESHVGNDCIVGGGCEVARSYIGNKTMLHRNYVGDSVLGEKVLMGAGVVTANFRFDKKTIKSMIEKNKIDSQLQKFGSIIGNNSKVGVNSTIFPGVKIGERSIVGPAEIVKEDLPDDIFLINGVRIDYKNKNKFS